MLASVPGLDAGAAQRVLATARADHGRALREVDAVLKEHPGALVTAPAACPLALVRLAHALIEAGYQTVAAPACAGCGKITIDLRRKTASGRPRRGTARLGAGRPDRHPHQHRRTLVPVGQTRLGCLCCRTQGQQPEHGGTADR